MKTQEKEIITEVMKQQDAILLAVSPYVFRGEYALYRERTPFIEYALYQLKQQSKEY